MCVPNSVDTEQCGNCGEKSRTCNSQCVWGQFTSCLGGGPCAIGEVQEQACGPDTSQGICEYGTETRTCNANCQWNAFGACFGAVYPKTEICGSSEDEDCDGFLEKNPDQYENNDTCGTCAYLGEDPDTTLSPTFDSADDEFDYYCFDGIDNFSFPGFGESVKVDLTNQSAGVDADMWLYRGTTACNNEDPVEAAVGPNQDKTIHYKVDEADFYIIKLRNYATSTANCNSTYKLQVNGLN